jgi:hypothetical protein
MARKATKALEDQDYSKLDAYSIGLNEFYKSLRRAGFSVDLALAIIVERSSYPDWILPSPINPNIPEPDWYDDEDE